MARETKTATNYYNKQNRNVLQRFEVQKSEEEEEGNVKQNILNAKAKAIFVYAFMVTK